MACFPVILRRALCAVIAVVLAHTPVQAQTTCGDAWTTQAFNAHNQERLAAGASALVCDTNASAISTAWAKTMCRRGALSHDGFSSRCKNAGYGNCGENVLYNFDNSANAGKVSTAQWRNSPGHYANMVNKVYTVMGIGYHKCPNGRVYWSALFGK